MADLCMQCDRLYCHCAQLGGFSPDPNGRGFDGSYSGEYRQLVPGKHEERKLAGVPAGASEPKNKGYRALVYFDTNMFGFGPNVNAFLLPCGVIFTAKHLPWCAVRKIADMGTNALIYDRDEQECLYKPAGENDIYQDHREAR